MTKLRPTMSWFPSMVCNLMAKPQGLRASSGNSRPRVTVENLTKTGVFSPTDDKKLAFWDVGKLTVNMILAVSLTYSEFSHILTTLEVSKGTRATRMNHAWHTSVKCKYGRVIIGLRSRLLDLLTVCCFLSPSQDRCVRSNKEDLLQRNVHICAT